MSQKSLASSFLEMSEKFQPYRRSQIWLGEPAELAAYRQEGEQINSRLYGSSEDKLYVIAADVTEEERVRWEAALRLSRERAEELANELVQREGDYWWASMVRLCPPSATVDIKRSLQNHSVSPDTRCRYRAMQLLSRMGEDSLMPRVFEMLKSSVKIERLIAVTCLEARDSQESRSRLQSYVADESNPTITRVRAATSLLRLGDSGYARILTDIALHINSESAYYAACSILHLVGKRQGLELFASILSQADHPAAPVTVMHVANLMGDYEQGFELAGLDKSRRWLETQLSNEVP